VPDANRIHSKGLPASGATPTERKPQYIRLSHLTSRTDRVIDARASTPYSPTAPGWAAGRTKPPDVPYAEAEGSLGRWTKADPAGRIPFRRVGLAGGTYPRRSCSVWFSPTARGAKREAPRRRAPPGRAQPLLRSGPVRRRTRRRSCTTPSATSLLARARPGHPSCCPRSSRGSRLDGCEGGAVAAAIAVQQAPRTA